ncbi:MAG: hypothetical protein LM517_05275 [Nitrosomonas sp.]|nr:hypothetical protein [Nitrosomonas sp.]
MEYEFMLKILMLIPGKFSTPIDTYGILDDDFNQSLSEQSRNFLHLK